MTILVNEIEENYANIRAKLISMDVTEQELKKLKNACILEINSKRRFGLIKSVEDLLVILEKRECLDSTNIQLLLDFADILKDRDVSEISVLLKHHQSLLFQWNRMSPLVARYDLVSPHLMFFEQFLNQAQYSPQVKVPNEVVTLISRELESQWMDFARGLAVLKESEIDRINETPGVNSDKIIEVLRVFESRARLANFRSTLLGALRAARRYDLHEDVQRLLLTTTPAH